MTDPNSSDKLSGDSAVKQGDDATSFSGAKAWAIAIIASISAVLIVFGMILGNGGQEESGDPEPPPNTTSSSATSSEQAPDRGEGDLEFPEYAPGSDRSPQAPARMIFPDGGAIKDISVEPVTTVNKYDPDLGGSYHSLIPSDKDIDSSTSWYEGSAKPGSGNSGTIVMVSHVDLGDIRGVGQMWQDNLTAVGSETTVVNHEGKEMVYRTTAAHEVDKLDAVSFENLAAVTFNRSEGPEALVLATCGGEFDPDSPLGYPLNHIIVMEPIVNPTV